MWPWIRKYLSLTRYNFYDLIINRLMQGSSPPIFRCLAPTILTQAKPTIMRHNSVPQWASIVVNAVDIDNTTWKRARQNLVAMTYNQLDLELNSNSVLNNDKRWRRAGPYIIFHKTGCLDPWCWLVDMQELWDTQVLQNTMTLILSLWNYDIMYILLRVDLSISQFKGVPHS